MFYEIIAVISGLDNLQLEVFDKKKNGLIQKKVFLCVHT